MRLTRDALREQERLLRDLPGLVERASTYSHCVAGWGAGR